MSASTSKGPTGFSGKLINPSGNETVLDQIASDGTHLHFAVNKLKPSYDGAWNDHEKAWKGSLTFQQIYPMTLRRATAEDIGPAVHKRPQEDAINARPAAHVQQETMSPAALKIITDWLSQRSLMPRRETSG